MTSRELIFLKLGGSLITDKTAVEVVREETLARLASEIAAACKERPQMNLIIGHGSGSFGHAVAAQYQTQNGVRNETEWAGFCQVSDAAARLNSRVRAALLGAGIPTITIQPSASAVCRDGTLIDMATAPISAALEARIVPLVYGDVAFDSMRGATIISTETVLGYLARNLEPQWLLLAGNTTGVFDTEGRVVPQISPDNFAAIAAALGASAGADVTGGMDSKVRDMLALVEAQVGLSVRIFSGMEEGRLQRMLVAPKQPAGTLIRA